MGLRHLFCPSIALVGALLAVDRDPAAARLQAFDPSLFQEFSWRNIGPFGGGATSAVAGVPGHSELAYAGASDGGVWKTTDHGRTWRPIFDAQPSGSIGALAVAPSDPDIVYAGTGATARSGRPALGRGVFKSEDAGQTWTPVGLDDSQQIARIAVDPRAPSRLFVAVLGHPYGPNEERGVFRSTDGGRTFNRVLFKDADTGASDVVIDPVNPQQVYAALWPTRRAPWDPITFAGRAGGIFKSTDGGTTWQPAMAGLPVDEPLGRVRLAIAPSRPERLLAAVAAASTGGVYQSNDAGASWTRVNATVATGEPATVEIDPKNPDVVYLTGASLMRSIDGGRTFRPWRSPSPGGTYGPIWIDPVDPSAIVLAGDRGAVMTMNGGASWSSSANQTTAGYTAIRTDSAFPYRVCGSRLDGEAGCQPVRTEHGQITSGDWRPVTGADAGVIAPDPLDPEIAFGGRLLRFDRRTGQTQDVTPPFDANSRLGTPMPLIFSLTDPRTLYLGTNVLWRTQESGQSWTAVSGDLSRETWAVPENVGIYRGSAGAVPARRGVLSAVAPSPIDQNVLWAGTTDGLVHVTRDAGRTWTDVTPPQLTAWSSIAAIEPSHFDVNTAYLAVDAVGLDDSRPYLYRTRDGGRSWRAAAAGLDPDTPVFVVREDTQRRGLLFAGTASTVAMSFDDGEAWQPLRLNLPPTAVRDLTIKDDDLIAGTAGRGLWVLDDITPLRQLTADVAKAPAFLFRPAGAWRFRDDRGTLAAAATDDPAAPNPADGIALSYLLGPETDGPLTLEIIETTTNTLIRRFSSGPAGGGPLLPTTPGLHRIVWDVRYTPPGQAPDEESPLATPSQGVWVMPGTYQVRLTAGGRVYRQAVLVRMDPRVKTPLADVRAQFTLSKAIADVLGEVAAARRAAARGDQPSPASVSALDSSLAALARHLRDIQQADSKPTAAAEAAAQRAIETARAVLIRTSEATTR